MNTYQSQQFWNSINSIIGFTASIMMLGFMVGMIKQVINNPGSPQRQLRITMVSKGWPIKEVWYIIPPLERVDIVGKFEYKGIPVIVLDKLLWRSPAFSSEGEIFIDKEFYDKVPEEVRLFALEHEFLETKYEELPFRESHRKIVGIEIPEVRDRAWGFWVNMVAKRLIESSDPDLRRRAYRVWGLASQDLKDRVAELRKMK